MACCQTGEWGVSNHPRSKDSFNQPLLVSTHEGPRGGRKRGNNFFPRKGNTVEKRIVPILDGENVNVVYQNVKKKNAPGLGPFCSMSGISFAPWNSFFCDWYAFFFASWDAHNFAFRNQFIFHPIVLMPGPRTQNQPNRKAGGFLSKSSNQKANFG